MVIKFVKRHVCFYRDHAANICICDIGHYRKKAYDNGLCQMIAPRTNRPKPHGFLNLPVVTEWQNLDADAVIFGAPFGKPYDPAEFPNDQSTAPSALRAASEGER